MSKKIRPILFISASFLLILQFFTFAAGQDFEATIKIGPNNTNLARIEGKFIRNSSRLDLKNIEFTSRYGDASDLDDRVSEVRVFDSQGRGSVPEKIGGSYWSDAEIQSWSYRIDLSPIKKIAAASRVSWVDANGGVLMLADTLPVVGDFDRFAGTKRNGKVKIDVPPGWKIFTTEVGLPTDWFDVIDLEKSSFVIGRNWRSQDLAVNGSAIRILLSGEWSFTDAEASSLVREVYSNYFRLFGSSPKNLSQIVVHKFPFPVSFGAWEADARGSSVTIVSSDMPFKSQSLQRLHEQFRHEIFHIWIPNGVNLPGDYDWFYEGFALYQSLKIGVAVNRIRFDDYLDTLSRAYSIDATNKDKMSLIVASGNRWNGANTKVYARGMIVAFLCDLAMLNASKGKVSTDDLLRKFYNDFKGANPGVDGNAAIIGTFNRHRELRTMVDRYVIGSEAVDEPALLKDSGFQIVRGDAGVKLSLVAKPSGRQKDLLDKLGYNSWRKLAKGN